MMTTPPLVRLENVTKVFSLGAEAASRTAGSWEVRVFENLSMEIAKGEMAALVGASGAGKSTLLHLIGALDRPTSGSIFFNEGSLNAASPDELAEIRNRQVGFVFQFHYLLPEFTALENVMMPLLVRGAEKEAARASAQKIFEEVGLAGKERHRAGELSGGEQQRVAIARALVTEPQLLLADEPTGNLDYRTSEAIIALLRSIHDEQSLTSVIATHNWEVARACDRVLKIEKGNLFEVDKSRSSM